MLFGSGFYEIPAALNSRDRARRANVLPLTLGPHGSNFEDVVSALKALIPLDRGVRVELKGQPTTMCVFCLCYIGDMPQQQENSGFKSQRATRGCQFCFIDESNRGDLEYDTVEHGRYHYQSLDMCNELNSKNTAKLRNNYARDWGINVTAPSLTKISPSLDIIMTRPGDPAHSEYGGVTRMMHEMLIQDILTNAAAKEYSHELRRFPFPSGYGRLQSPLHHLRSYSLSDHARWSIVVPCLLRTWLKMSHIQPSFTRMAQKHTDDPVSYVVSSFAMVAKNNSLLMADQINSEADRENLGEIVKRTRARFQQLCQDCAGGVDSNPRRLATSVRPGSQAAGRTGSRAGTPAVDGPLLPGGQEMLTGASGDGSVEKKKAVQYLNDMKKPNVHTALHFAEVAKEFGLPSNVSVLIGEDKYR